MRTRDAAPHAEMCVCVCVCVCVRACAERSKTDRQITLWASGASKRSNTHKKYVTMASYESIHLNSLS